MNETIKLLIFFGIMVSVLGFSILKSIEMYREQKYGEFSDFILYYRIIVAILIGVIILLIANILSKWTG